ncbi:hypothetical protein FB451DRAFT_242945 [Mycena latifolia]|nr:hypothetical protein FB451DRAFT_242945 [Mycena latifolia]
MTGSLIGGVIAAVLCALLAAFCLIRRCRRRRPDGPDIIYPFQATSTSEASVPREMVGRSGYPASTFSSWGNHGDLADERALSPTTPVANTEGPPWEAGQSTIESRYASAFTPGHTASSSSIDRNDPSSQRRFRGPIPKNMMDAIHPGPVDSPSSAILGEHSQSARSEDGNPAQIFDEIRPQEMPSWGRMPDKMAGRQPVIVGYPPPYTSR